MQKQSLNYYLLGTESPTKSANANRCPKQKQINVGSRPRKFELKTSYTVVGHEEVDV